MRGRASEHSRPTFRMQPCMSPVWDTAYAHFRAGRSGVSGDDPRMVKAGEWMLQKAGHDTRATGRVKVPNVEPGGWYFEFNNEFYPDVDDSAQVLLALTRSRRSNERYQDETCRTRDRLDFGDAVQETAAGRRSTKTTPRWSSSTSRLPITTRCSIRRRWTSPDGCWRCWPPTATRLMRPVR